MGANIINQGSTLPTSETKSSNINKSVKFIPPLFYIVAAFTIILSISYPYWAMVLLAPQYPGGLEMNVYVNYITGDDDPRMDEVREIDGLNHYIGMKSLYEAAKFERSIAIPAVITMVVFLVIAALWHKRWAWILTIPAIGFPFVFLADLAFWMNYYGQNLDPYAPLSSAIKPFTPPILGEGIIGQFSTIAHVDTGWLMTVGASTLTLIGLLIRFGTYRAKQSQEV